MGLNQSVYERNTRQKQHEQWASNEMKLHFKIPGGDLELCLVWGSEYSMPLSIPHTYALKLNLYVRVSTWQVRWRKWSNSSMLWWKVRVPFLSVPLSVSLSLCLSLSHIFVSVSASVSLCVCLFLCVFVPPLSCIFCLWSLSQNTLLCCIHHNGNIVLLVECGQLKACRTNLQVRESGKSRVYNKLRKIYLRKSTIYLQTKHCLIF